MIIISQFGQIFNARKHMLMSPQIRIAMTYIVYNKGTVIESANYIAIDIRFISTDKRVVP